MVTWTAAGGGEGERSKTKGKTWRGQRKRKWWWFEKKSPIRKVRRDQRGLGPRLRVARRAVGAKGPISGSMRDPALQAEESICHGWQLLTRELRLDDAFLTDLRPRPASQSKFLTSVGMA